ncbi:ion channel, cNMP-binding protein [Artemisia annua]|uniref:Ion channel, cNMP-binding protein n=1 Tax=Artemisia annua TaxID=35608 RepID=A0A2U1NI12_ARTAN|nr:ion channel, cNMP-binding protein [Artemisia annua]
MFSRWIKGGILQERSNYEKDETQQCFVCSQSGIPNFHSTSCDPTHQPAWEALAGSSLVPIKSREAPKQNKKAPSSSSGPGHISSILDPRSDSVRWLSQVVLLARFAALAVDPFFFFALAVDDDGSAHGGRCVYIDDRVVKAVSIVRTCVDAMHLCHVWLQFHLAYVSKESLVVGCGTLVWDPRDIAFHYLRSLTGFWLDAFVLLPIPQVFYLWMLPRFLREEKISLIMKLIQVIFMIHFVPKVYHCSRLMRRARLVTGYIFGSVWWRIGLSFLAYFLASHASGGYWYALAIRRVVLCLTKQCEASKKCSSLFLSCSSKANSNNSMCFDDDGPFPYGIYESAIPILSYDSIAARILYSNYWGLISFRQENLTMGNILEPTSEVLEVIFSIFMVIIGLLLFTMLVANIQVFLIALTGRTTKMQVRSRDMEWWMKRRQLPSDLIRRVRHFENQRWSVMGGQDDMEMVKHLPEGLRRDIKRYLCLDLVKKIIREGDPVHRMVFIVHGQVKRTQWLSRGMAATSTLEPGSFFGDELLSWCLRIPFIERYPSATATFTCLKPTEAFVLDANHLRYITDHFRYMFINEKMKRRARYYSSNWRTWAAINIQLAWRRYISRTRGRSAIYRARNSDRLQHYAAMFMSFRPHDHLE